MPEGSSYDYVIVGAARGEHEDQGGGQDQQSLHGRRA